MSNNEEAACCPAPERIPAILVVEDEPLIRMAVSDHLQGCGFKVFEAINADEALKMIVSGEGHIDLVFTDVRIPGEMDGIGLAKWIRENRPGLPVILVSGDTKKTDVASELCAQERFLIKPYDLDKVVAHIREDIGARRNASESSPAL